MGGTTPVRRNMLDRVAAEHGDTLYDFALALTDDPDSAAAAVAEAIPAAVAEHGPGVARPALFHAVLVTAASLAPPAPWLPGDLLDSGSGTPDALTRLSRQVTRSLDPRDRAILDLSLRQGLEGEDLAEAIGIPPGQTSAVTRSAVDIAERVVGAVLVSRLARDDCAGLAVLLADLPPETTAERLAEEVSSHEESCTACGDRRRALVPVTSLLAAVPPTPAPADVLGATRRPAPPPPPPAAPAGPSRQRRRLFGGTPAPGVLGGTPAPGVLGGTPAPARLAGAVIGAVLVVVAGLALTRSEEERTTGPVAGGRLEATRQPLVIADETASATLDVANPGTEPLEFSARTGAPWLTVEPPGGRLEAGGQLRLTVALDRDRAPEGDTASEVRLVSTGGSTVIPVQTAVERPPVLSGLTTAPEAAVALGCQGAGPLVGRASVVEESGLERVELRQRGPDGAETVSAMTRDGASWTAALGPFPSAGVALWWVTAVDIRGNTASSDPRPVTVTGC